MSMNDTVLERLAEWRPVAGAGPETLHIPDAGNGWSVSVSAEKNDEVGTLVRELTVHRNAPAPQGATLKGWARGAADRVTGLLEPLRLLEVDDGRDEAVLRSQKPTKRGGSLHYYEARLKGTEEATLRRYQASPTAPGRTQVPFPVTHEALAKVVDDLTGA